MGKGEHIFPGWQREVGSEGDVRSQIIEYMFTNKEFYEADPSRPVSLWLYFFTHMALKTRCEAVVEGMGGVLDIHADKRRHLPMNKSLAEAMIHWNGPLSHEADDFLKRALDKHFSGKPWNFHRTDKQWDSVYPHGPKLGSLLRRKSKFPFWAPQ